MKIKTAFKYLKAKKLFFLIKQKKISSNKPLGKDERFVNSCYFTLRYFKKEFKPFLNQIPIFNNVIKNKKKVIWWVWLQGISEMPDLQKTCLLSLKKQYKDIPIITIDENNYYRYIDLPSFIIEKYNSGIIPPAHFCDILRTELLIKYGGTYIDSTFISFAPNDVIFNDDFFVFKEITTNNSSFSASNFIINSHAENPILKTTLFLLYQYWKKYNFVCHYYIYYFFFTIAVERYPSLWESYLNYNNVLPQLLLSELNNPFDKKLFSDIIHFFPLQKLFLVKNPIKGSFYDRIINDYNF